MKRDIRQNKAITLIALVITIIVLLILSGVVIAMLTGENGLLSRTTQAREESIKGEERDKLAVAYHTAVVNKKSTNITAEVTADDLNDVFESDGTNALAETEAGQIKVTFNETGNYYYINSNGTISETQSSTPVATYTITYHPNNGMDTDTTVQNKNAGEEVIIQNCTFSQPTGKIFLKWSTDTSGTDTYEPGMGYSNDSDLVLYAIWEDPSCCFAEGTLVYTEEGLRPIETIKIGEKVWTLNENTFEKELKPVTNTFDKQRACIYEILVNNEIITCTKDHSLYVANKGWTKCEDINVGEYLIDINNNNVKVDNVKPLNDKQLMSVYNLEVEDNHNYLVSNMYILVHNGRVNPPEPVPFPDEPPSCYAP